MRTEEEIRADAAPTVPFSNGTEFYDWADRHCCRCRNDAMGLADADEPNCPILTVTLIDRTWPKEWPPETHTWTANGKTGSYRYVDTCTEFDERPEPGDDPDPEPEPDPPPECVGQLDIIDVVLDDAIAELTRAPEAAVR